MNVTIYTKPNCQPCRATKRTLDRIGVEYDELPADEHTDVLAPLGHLVAPVVVVTDPTGAVVDSWGGFSPDKCRGLAR